MIYLFLGQDVAAKDLKLAALKEKFLSCKESHEFDFDILHAAKLDSDTLKKSLIALPAIEKVRLVVVRCIEKLSQHNKDIILRFLEEKETKTILILDGASLDGKTKFYKELSKCATVERVRSDVKGNVFDVTKAIESRRIDEALKQLTNIMNDGQHPLQIMGGLVWFWGKMRGRIKEASFKKGLLELQEADLNIKRSRIRPDYAMEVLVTKLTSLIAY
ncbi:MAG: DNA polymerase III delta subunit [Lysobacterales bacterium]|jgi:DNA polymerase III delta subunit